MPDPTPYAPASAPAPKRGIDATFAYIVGLLLIFIIAALTGVSLKYYKLTRSYATELQKANDAIVFLRDFQANPMAFQPVVARDALPRQAAQLDGRNVDVLELDASLGRLMGFAPGDVLRVGAAASQPATAPSAHRPPARGDTMPELPEARTIARRWTRCCAAGASSGWSCSGPTR